MTYTRLLETATDHFGRKGFEGASTREIAAASGTAMSSITYHFGGKEGLYLAVADHIAAQIAERQASSLAVAGASASLTREQATDAILIMMESFGRMMLAPESAAWARFVVREQQDPTAAFERLYEGVMRAMNDAFIRLIAVARPDLCEREARMIGIFFFGQAVILRVGLASVCRSLDTDALDPAIQAELLTRLRANNLSVLSEKTE